MADLADKVYDATNITRYCTTVNLALSTPSESGHNSLTILEKQISKLSAHINTLSIGSSNKKMIVLDLNLAMVVKIAGIILIASTNPLENEKHLDEGLHRPRDFGLRINVDKR